LLSPVELKYSPNLIEQTLEDIRGLISLPEVYQKIRELMDDPESDIDQFVGVVSSDPNLTATVLKVANSAFFGFPGKIDSISRAVSMLGLTQLHDLVLATSAINSLDLPNEVMPLRTFWRFSLFSAVLSRLLANQLKIPRGERLFIIGLLHEIGHLIMYAKYPEQAKLAMSRAENDQQTLHILEQNMLGLHYGEIGAKMLALWRLPSNFQNIVHYQPTPGFAEADVIETTLLHVVHGFAQKLTLNHEQPIENLVNPQAWAILNLTPEQIDDALETALQACLDMEKLMFS
jgi:HD-like signal output (HDOD) protein